MESELLSYPEEGTIITGFKVGFNYAEKQSSFDPVCFEWPGEFEYDCNWEVDEIIFDEESFVVTASRPLSGYAGINLHHDNFFVTSINGYSWSAKKEGIF